MRPEFIKPSLELSKLVSRYMILKNAENNSLLSNFIIPAGFVGIVFNLKKNKTPLKIEGNISLPDFFIATPNNKQIQIDTSFPFELFIVLCRASVFYPIFDLNPEDFYNDVIINHDIFEGYPMLKTLREIGYTRERIGFFENFILNSTPLRGYSSANFCIQNGMISKTLI